MDTLQISPIVGFKPAVASTGSPGGEASSTHSDSKSSAPAVFNPNGQTQEQVTAARAQEARAAAQRAAEAKAEEAKKAAQAEDAEKSLDLKVGLVSGSSTKVFVDIVDPKLNRTVYRIFGPPANDTAPKPHEAEAHDTGDTGTGDTSTSDAGAKPADATNAYSRTGTPADQPANLKTDA